MIHGEELLFMKSKMKFLSIPLALALALALLPSAVRPAAATDGEFNAGDVAVINAIIDNNGLSWEPADPADGSNVPPDWDGAVTWSGAPGDSDRRVTGLELSGMELTGAMDISALASLISLSCDDNALTALNISDLASLTSLSCSGNKLTELTLSPDATYANIDVSYNYMADASAVTGQAITWDESDYIFTPQRTPPAQLRESTPSSIVNYPAEKLTGLAAGAAYTVSYTAGSPPAMVTVTASADTSGRIDIQAAWMGKTIDLVKTGAVADGTVDSLPQQIALPARPGAPDSIGKTDATSGNNGTITGVNNTMEYMRTTANSWTSISGTTVTGLAAGTYIVRYKATTTTFASDPGPIIIIAGSPSSGSSGSGGSTIVVKTIPAEGGVATVNYTQSGGMVTLDVSDIKATEIISKCKDGVVNLDLSKVSGAINATMPKAALSRFAGVGFALEIKLPQGTLKLDNAALKDIAENAGGASVSLSINAVKQESLPPLQKAAVRPNDLVFNVTAMSVSEVLTSFKGTLTVSLPYSGATPVAVWYLNNAGKLEEIACSYNSSTRIVSFTTDHLSIYVIGKSTAPQPEAPPAAPPAAVNPFSDISSDAWYYDDVLWSYENGLMHGIAADTFGPAYALTRATLVTSLYRYAGEPSVDGVTNPFDDVASDQWYTNAIIWAVDKGIVTGKGSGKFAPDAAITRQDLMVILMRYMSFLKVNKPVDDQYIIFSDEANISDYAKDAIQTCYKLKIMNGIATDADGRTIIDPLGNATRAQVAVLLRRFVSAIS